MRHLTNGVRPGRKQPANTIRQWAFTLIEVVIGLTILTMITGTG